jgi:hypothetical protein
LIGRRLIVVALVLLLAVQVVRNAAVAKLADLQPAAAAQLWRGHPQVEISLGMVEIAQAVRRRTEVNQATFAMIHDAAVKSPLSPEPFLVHGVQAQMAGDAEAANRAFRNAQWRDPRSVPAAYFLAEYNLRSGRLLEGLNELAALARLVPQSAPSMAPFLASYVQNRSNWPQIRALFRKEERLEETVLWTLSQDARNADTVLALASPDNRKPSSSWLPVLVTKMVQAGDYAKARAVWASVSGVRPGNALLYDADFSAPAAPPPFNWQLESSTVGLAERQPGKRLHILFYGNQDGVLASELLMLPAGPYRLNMRVAGSPAHPELLSWSVRCDQSHEPISTIGISDAATRGWTFQVPPGCRAQWLELSGRSADVSQQSDVTIGGLNLVRVAS